MQNIHLLTNLLLTVKLPSYTKLASRVYTVFVRTLGLHFFYFSCFSSRHFSTSPRFVASKGSGLVNFPVPNSSSAYLSICISTFLSTYIPIFLFTIYLLILFSLSTYLHIHFHTYIYSYLHSLSTYLL